MHVTLLNGLSSNEMVPHSKSEAKTIHSSGSLTSFHIKRVSSSILWIKRCIVLLADSQQSNLCV